MKKHLVILGKVQGVGFRYWMQNLAIENNISGWIKNKMSGDVEALIVGQEKEIRELIKLCEMGPGSAIVDRVQINDYDKDYSKEGFDIF
jgi:acylphosphatase